VVAIIYGASWCKPCHAAEDYLKGRGVTVVMKDIEASEAAQAEMQQKLARVGRAGASIPVIDVMGQILIGYSPGSLDSAIRTAQNAKAL
jgi:glutaredoxin